MPQYFPLAKSSLRESKRRKRSGWKEEEGRGGREQGERIERKENKERRKGRKEVEPRKKTAK